jgi:hypothetical protein
MQQQTDSIFGEVIYSYTRASAIDDGVLVDVSELAKRAGFKFPVAITQAVWAGYITPPKESRKWGQSEAGRLGDTLFMLSQAIRKGVEGDTIYFEVIYTNGQTYERDIDGVSLSPGEIKSQTKRLKSVCGPGDNYEPVITIMKQNED